VDFIRKNSGQNLLKRFCEVPGVVRYCRGARRLWREDFEGLKWRSGEIVGVVHLRGQVVEIDDLVNSELAG
jgi:hypothetical protein